MNPGGRFFAGILVAASAVAGLSFVAQGKTLVVENGKSDYEIITRAKAPMVTTYAANELREYFRKVCGVEMRVTSEPTPGKKAIFVGSNPLLSGMPELDGKGFASEERFLIRELDNGSIVIMGADSDAKPETVDFGNFGLLFGTYEFIERFLGVRWYVPGKFGECFREMRTVEVSGLPIDQKPNMWWRHYWPNIINEFSAKDSFAWGRRLKGYGMKPYAANHSMMDMGRVFRESRPHIFALNPDGSRHLGELKPDGKGWLEYPQFCLSHPDTLKSYVELVDAVYGDKPEGKEWKRCRPDQNYVYVIPDDNFRPNPCYCKDCQAKMDISMGQKGVQSQLVWEFVAKVAEHVKKKYPDKKVVGLPYEGYLVPPKNLKLPDNVVAHICVNPYVIYSGLPEYDRQADQFLVDWGKLVGEITVWHYFLPYADYPYVMPRRLVKWYMSHPAVKASFIELMDTTLRKPNLPKSPEHKCVVSTDLAQSHLNLYFSMKAMWGAAFDIDKELETYYELFHGPAAKPMRDFNTLIMSRWENVTGVETQKTAYSGFSGKDIYEKIYPKEVVDKLDSDLREAEALTKPGSVYRERIDWIRKSYFDAFKASSDAFDKEAKSSKTSVVFVESARPSVDGDVSDEYWRNKEERLFKRYDAPLAPRFPTRLKIGMDEENIYLSIDAEDPDSGSQLLVNNNKDGQVYCDDSYEVFLCPNPDKPESYYQIAVNLNDFVFDHKVEGKKSDIAWDSGIVTKTRRLDGRWVSEAAIPLKNMGLKAEDGADWRFNVCRSKRSGVGENGELSQWHTTYGGFPKTDAMPVMFVLKKDPKSFGAVFDSTENAPVSLSLALYDKDSKRSVRNDGVGVEFKNGSASVKINFPKAEVLGKDNAIVLLKNAKGADLDGRHFCEVRYRNPDPKVTLLAVYSFEAEDGKTYSDYFRFAQNEAQPDWRVRSFDIRKDGLNVGRSIKEGGSPLPAPKKLTYFAVYAQRCAAAGAPMDAEFGLSYARFTGKPLKEGLSK